MRNRATPLRLRLRGFTLVETLLVVAVLVIIIATAAPAINRMIQMQRLRSISSQVVTDLQFARAEAVARRDFMRVRFSKTDNVMTCYTIYTSVALVDDTPCDCTAGVGSACGVGHTEVRTVQVPAGLQVLLTTPVAQDNDKFAFDWRTGGLYLAPTDSEPRPASGFIIESTLDSDRALNVRLNPAGRVTVCKPAGSKMTEAACP